VRKNQVSKNMSEQSCYRLENTWEGWAKVDDEAQGRINRCCTTFAIFVIDIQRYKHVVRKTTRDFSRDMC